MSDADANGSPTDRSKRPRQNEEGDWPANNEHHGQEDRHPKRQAVPDPETKAPHFVSTNDNDQEKPGADYGSNSNATSKMRGKKWDEYHNGLQESDGGEDEVQTLLHQSEQPARNTTTSNNNGAPSAKSSVTSSSGPVTEEGASIAPIVSIRSIVNTKDAGVIIGRGGKNVNEIRERSAAKVTISDIVQGAYERILTVHGPVEAVAKAYSLVAEKILSEMQNEDNQEQTITIRLLVADSRMGTLIGRGGSVIRTIQEQSHARITASEESLPMSTERTVTIVGTPEATRAAVQQVAEILAEHPERSVNTMPYRPMPANPAMVAGRGYHSMRAPGSAMPYGMMGPMGDMSMGGANPQFYYQAAAAAAAAATGGYGMMPTAAGRQSGYGMANMMVGSQAEQIFIPNEMVGCIIGKGGSKINEIRQLSGSHIKIADPHGNTNERLVTITGTPESNQMALYLLYARMESEKNRMGMH